MKRTKKTREEKIAAKAAKKREKSIETTSEAETQNNSKCESVQAFCKKVTKKSLRPISYPVLSDDIQRVLDFFRDIERQYDMSLQDYELYNYECQDLIHGIEFGWIGNHRKACYTALKNSRINRRTAKNRQELMEKVIGFMANYPNLIHDLSDLLGWVKRKEEQQASRGYAPRTQILDKVIGRYDDE